MSDTVPRAQLPRLVVVRLWSNLPVLMVSNLMLTLALLPAGLLYLVGMALPSVLVAGVCLGTAWAGTVAVTERMVRDEAVSIGAALREFGRLGGPSRVGARFGAYGGLLATVTLATSTLVRANPEQRWLLVPLFVDGTVIVLAALAGLVAFPLAITDRLRGQRLLWCSLLQVARNPWPIAGTVALLVLAGFAVSFVPSLAVLLPAPVALLLSELVRGARDRTRAAIGAG